MKKIVFLICFFSLSQPVYAISYSYDDLGRLVSVSYQNSENGTFSYDPAGNLLSVTVQPDADSDGILDSADPDDDNDGLPDTYELANNLNPLDAADAALDSDNDGLTILQEYLAGSSLALADTDGDGATDGEEVDSGSNPLDQTSVPSWMMPSGGGWRYILQAK